ncbi:MAG: glycosyltransferase family 1 protein [Pseudomonadota bacterium]
MSATERPRIHWVGPLPPAQTDIAAMTRRILPALAERADVVLWTDADQWDPSLEAHALVRRYDAGAHFPMPLDSLPPAAGIEAVFFQIGNSWLFHAGPLNLARRVPGVVVLHDLAIQDLLAGMLANGHFEARIYRAEMARWYGANGRSAAERMLARRASPADIAATMPLFEIALPRAVAALTHTEAGWTEVAGRAMLPSWQLDLPFAPTPEIPAARATDGPLRLVQFGYLAPNRRLDQVLEALAGVKRHVWAELDVFGTLWDERHVRGKIAELGLVDRVRLRGFAPEPELDAALAAAHLVFNLRNPSMGEASGSQLRIWNASAASVVTDIGWYAALPEDCVLKVPATGEAEALTDLLQRLDRDRGQCSALGAAGRARLVARHGPERYAHGLVEAAARYGADARAALMAEAARDLLARTPRPRLARDRLAEQL